MLDSSLYCLFLNWGIGRIGNDTAFNLILKLRYLDQSNCVNWPIEESMRSMCKISIHARSYLHKYKHELKSGMVGCKRCRRNSSKNFIHLVECHTAVTIINGHLSSTIAITHQQIYTPILSFNAVPMECAWRRKCVNAIFNIKHDKRRRISLMHSWIDEDRVTNWEPMWRAHFVAMFAISNVW